MEYVVRQNFLESISVINMYDYTELGIKNQKLKYFSLLGFVHSYMLRSILGVKWLLTSQIYLDSHMLI